METLPANSSHEEFYKPGTIQIEVSRLEDGELERRLHDLAAKEAESTSDVVAHIHEFEKRRLFGKKSFPSMFEYCTRVLGYSEGAAYLRIYAGRLAVDYPQVLDLLRSRRLHLTAIRTVGPHLRPWNCARLLEGSVARTERELKFLVAEGAPKPAPAEVIRRLPVPAPPAGSAPSEGAEAVEPRPAVVPPPFQFIEPLAPTRVRFAFNGSPEFLADLDRLRELLRHRFPAGHLEDMLAAAVEFYLSKHDPARKAKPAPARKTNPRRRTPPRWVKDAVFRRDGGRCAFVSKEGVRCGERGGHEYDHIVPWARGGRSDDPVNIRLLCRTHNSLEAERIFGPRNC